MKLESTPRTMIGVFCISLATLMYEILLTRIFSVTMFYHFAFAAISIAMFGMTAGAVLVYVLPMHFKDSAVHLRLTQYGFAFSLAIVLSFITHLSIPFIDTTSLVKVYGVLLNFTILTSPFVLSGIVMSLALTRFKEGVSHLYAADLIGAATGCVVLILSLQFLDGPSDVVLAAAIAGAGAWIFSRDANDKHVSRSALLSTLALFIFVILNGALAGAGSAPLRLVWVKGEVEPPLLYEKWNSYSRITIAGDPNTPSSPTGWGLSRAYEGKQKKLVQLQITIDALASTVLTEFDGKNLEPLEYLKYDVTNVAHYIRKDSDVLVIGVGGGRDILSALVFKQKSVLGLEVNQNIISLLTGRYADLTGNLPKNPAVKIVDDEARSYITRTEKKFDILQVSLIDTWAASSSGAYALSENSLYTVEAWKLFLNRLNPRGILSFSRWYLRDNPYEMYRLTSLATEALMQNGIDAPRQHIVIVRYISHEDSGTANLGVGTLLASNLPFTKADLDELERVSQEMGFEIVLSPHSAINKTFSDIADGKNIDQIITDHRFNLSAPTDDSPFFFLYLRLKYALSPKYDPVPGQGQLAITTLVSLSVLVFFLTLLCILLPLRMTLDRAHLKGSGFAFVYFASIGLAFMLIEFSQMQRLVLFLGHPVYGLSVVLFTLLLASGIGSSTTQRIQPGDLIKRGETRLFGLLGLLIFFGLITPQVTRLFAGAETPTRMMVALLLVFIPGVFMGMAFPLGIKLASRRSVDITPWLWGINGATSVWASIIGMLIALSFGISVAFWTGVVCYGVAISVWRRVRVNG